MKPSAIAVIRASGAALAGRADTIDPVFARVLRTQAPAVAAVAPPGLASAVVAVLMADEGADRPAVLDELLRDGRAGPRAAAAVGLALAVALVRVLGPGFDDAVQAAWSEAYVELVQQLMAARWNRMDLVA